MAFPKKWINGNDVFGSNHKYGVYAYINKQTDEVLYIGKCSNINESSRHRKHLAPSAKAKQRINTWLQNNPDKWRYEIIALCSTKEWMEDLEAALMEQFKMINQCKWNIVNEIRRSI